MRRREFVAGLGGAAVVGPRGASSQQGERVRRVGVLMNVADDDQEAKPRFDPFVKTLRELGWTEGRNIRIDSRWGAASEERYRRQAAELVALAPDVVLATNTSTTRALQRASRTVPIVFTSAVDPVGGGLVASIARPGGNITGFAAFEFGMSGKWIELLKEIAPQTKRAAVLRDATTTGGAGQLGAIQAAASSFGIEVSPLDVHDPAEIERTIAGFARGANSSLVVVSTAFAAAHRELIIRLAAQYKLPAVFPYRFFAESGGLLSYGSDRAEPVRRAAGYVDRILKGEKPADLPVQAPTKYELVINLKTARALGLTVPPTLLARADGVIE